MNHSVSQTKIALKKGLFWFFSFVLFLYCFLLMAELLLVLKNRQNEGNLNEKPTFNTQYLHPYYYFSFSQNPKILQKINTEESWVDTRGFRGEGSEKKDLES